MTERGDVLPVRAGVIRRPWPRERPSHGDVLPVRAGVIRYGRAASGRAGGLVLPVRAGVIRCCTARLAVVGRCSPYARG